MLFFFFFHSSSSGELGRRVVRGACGELSMYYNFIQRNNISLAFAAILLNGGEGFNEAYGLIKICKNEMFDFCCGRSLFIVA